MKMFKLICKLLLIPAVLPLTLLQWVLTFLCGFSYVTLMSEKREAYSEYRKVRNEMKELLTAKANVDRILEKDADREQWESESKAILLKSRSRTEMCVSGDRGMPQQAEKPSVSAKAEIGGFV